MRQFLSSSWQLLRWRLAKKDYCCSWLLLDLLTVSRLLCSFAVTPSWVLCCVVMLHTVPGSDLPRRKRMSNLRRRRRKEKKQAWLGKEVALHPPI